MKYILAITLGVLLGEAQAHITRAQWGWYWDASKSGILGHWEGYVLYDVQCPFWAINSRCNFFTSFLSRRT